MKFLKREYYTLAKDLKNINLEYPKFIIENKLYKKINLSIQKLIEFDSNSHLPKLHRWCNTTSNRYKNICNWEKKLDNAQNDNCYTSFINNK